jgi:hypothetical protein
MWAIIRQVLQLLILKICLQMTISFKEPILKSSLPLLTLFKLSASSTIHGVRDRWTGPSKIPKGVYILHFKYTNYQYWCMESAEMFFFRTSNSPACEESWYAKTRQGNTKDRFTLASHKISQMLTPLLMRNVDMCRTRHSIYLVPLSVFRRAHCTRLLMRYYIH